MKNTQFVQLNKNIHYCTWIKRSKYLLTIIHVVEEPKNPASYWPLIAIISLTSAPFINAKDEQNKVNNSVRTVIKKTNIDRQRVTACESERDKANGSWTRPGPIKYASDALEIRPRDRFSPLPPRLPPFSCPFHPIFFISPLLSSPLSPQVGNVSFV